MTIASIGDARTARAEQRESIRTIDFLVPTYRRSHLLLACIESIFAQGYAIGHVFLTYRPDDDPDAVTWLAAHATRWHNLVPVPLYVPGKVAALNTALALSTADIVAMIDDDNVLRDGWLGTILGHFDDPLVAAVGGRDYVHGPGGNEGLGPATKAGYQDFWGKTVGDHNVIEGPARAVDNLKGCDWAVRRAALGSLRFDNRLLGIGAQAGDDTWFCLNLRHAGWKIILDPAARTDHYPAFKPDYDQGTWGRKKCYEWTANAVAFHLAYLPLARKIRYVGFFLVVGQRNCPGLYYIAHSLAKRPRDLPGQMVGGWSGFWKGWGMAREFGRNPPGYPAKPPLIG